MNPNSPLGTVLWAASGVAAAVCGWAAITMQARDTYRAIRRRRQS